MLLTLTASIWEKVLLTAYLRVRMQLTASLRDIIMLTGPLMNSTSVERDTAPAPWRDMMLLTYSLREI